uniref:G_PROTEIN_RECEP_F1_2 domain-containing protein n=2 Tax=Steinernema glaseri TaxID=37863 RepID=A0A1I8AM18_9BILA
MEVLMWSTYFDGLLTSEKKQFIFEMVLPFEPNEQSIAALIILLTGLTGVFINLFVILGVTKTQTFGSSFGKICISQSIANCGNAFVFSCLVAPISLIDPSVHSTYWGARCGQVLIIFWNGSIFSHLLTAVNRFSVIYFPTRYVRLFNKRNTTISVAMIWVIGLCQAAPYLDYNCTFEFETFSMTFAFVKTTCGTVVGTYLDFYLSLVVIGTVGVIDIITLIGIRLMNKRGVVTDEVEKGRRKRREVKFFFQAFAQAIVFVTELVLYFYVSSFPENKWVRFGMTTFMWIFMQTLDASIVIAFNKEIRSIACRGTTVSALSSTNQYS